MLKNEKTSFIEFFAFKRYLGFEIKISNLKRKIKVKLQNLKFKGQEMTTFAPVLYICVGHYQKDFYLQIWEGSIKNKLKRQFKSC